MPLGLGYILTAAVDNYVYGFGGDIFDGASLIAQTIAERYDPVAGTWSDAAVADLPVAGDEGRGFGFDSNSIYPYPNQIVLATLAQWSGDSNVVILYDVASNSYDQNFPDLVVATRNHGGTLIPICTADPADGLPGMWVIGGRAGADTPPYHQPEYFPLPCATAPIASFDSSSPDCLGETTVFTDTSAGNPTEWAWDFGDGGTSDVQNPTHLYATAGDFVVTLVATNTEGSDSATGTVTINGLPDASFVYAPHAGLMPLTVYFTATGSNVMTPTWEFGDTGTGTGWTIQHTYVATGTYPVTMTAVGLCGTIVQTGEVIVTFEMAPVASFTADPMTGCGAPLVVHFTDTSMAVPPVTEWFWDFGDAVGTSMEQNPVYTYTTTGDFVVTLLVTSTLGSDSVTDTISVYDLPVATFDYAPAVGNAPLTVYFTDTSMFGGDPIWDFGDATFGAGATVTHTYAATGTYTVILTTTSPLGCGDATATGIVQVNAPGTCIPVNIVSVDQTPAGCVVGFAATLTGDAPFTYLWDFGTFGTFTTTTATVNFGATGTYTGTLDVWNCTAGHDMEPISVDVDCMPAPVFKIYLPLVYRGY
jgi:PKD repeat protein